MGDSGATVIVHQTRVSQPDGCAPLPPTGISSYPEERPLRVYGTATLIAGETALHQECAFHLVGHLNSQTQPSPPHLRQQGGRGTSRTSFCNVCQGYSLGNGASL
ncbi:unnamed protein product [Rangifer tarandus platyrhynchus]|uniref:Uncharacterized protein n=1 Tax=Rangifer tarandus platyrhynchus TaxID=3082113 RepID=A0ABN9A1I0_RANTA|nr:unnamed protein product [Rangifer tarandus platyrhynchus]